MSPTPKPVFFRITNHFGRFFPSLILPALLFTVINASAADHRQWGPFVIPATTNWSVGGHYDTVRARGLLYTPANSDAPSEQVVFFNNTTPNNSKEQHLSYFKRFLGNIRTTYPNASITYASILEDRVPFIHVFDLTGETLFWGTLHHNGYSHDIGITVQDRCDDIPADILQLLGNLTTLPNE